MAKRSLIGLDIGSKVVKAVELTSGSERPQVTGFAQAEIANPAQVNEVLSQIVSRGGFRTNRVATAVSGRSVIVRYVNMPRMGDQELKNAVRYEAGKYIPFEVDEVVLDCQRLEEDGAGDAKEMRVVLVAVKKSLIDSHIGMLEGAGLAPAIIDVDSFALGNAYELSARASGKPPENTVVALVDIGAYKTNINIVRQKNVAGAGVLESCFTREVYLAGNDFTDAIQKKMNLDTNAAEALKRKPNGQAEEVKEIVSSALDDLCHEIHLSFDFFENQFDMEVQQVYLCGGSSRIPGVDEAFSRTFADRIGLRPWDPLAGVDIKLDRGTPDQVRVAGPQLAIGLGLASRIDDK